MYTLNEWLLWGGLSLLHILLIGCVTFTIDMHAVLEKGVGTLALYKPVRESGETLLSGLASRSSWRRENRL